MNSFKKKPMFGRFRNMLSQMPNGIGKKIFLYGLPILSAVLVIAVVATSILVGSAQSKADFGKLEKETNQDLISQVNIESLEQVEVPQLIEKDLAQIKRDTSAFALRDLVEEGTGVALKEENTISISEIQAAERVENVEASVEEKPEVNKPSEAQLAGADVNIEEDSVPSDNSDQPTDIEDADQESEYVETWVEKYVNTEILNIRETPSFDASVIGTFEQGDLITEISTDYEWSAILLAEGKIGYVYNYHLTADYVEPKVEAQPEVTVEESSFTEASGTMYIGVGAANIRSEANTNSNVNVVLYYGAPVYLNSYASGWYYITDDSGNAGYVREDMLRNTPVPQEEIDALQNVAESPSPNPETTPETTPVPEPTPAPEPEQPVAPGGSGGVAAAQIAASKAGLPYVYGAAGPNAFDCSGLVQYAVIQAGGYISRTAASQASAGIAVSFSQLAPGDVLCFAFSGGGISHSGMYIGGGQFVHAMNPSDGIQINSLSGYWASSLAYARRVFY